MKNYYTYLTLIVAFLMLTSMSECMNQEGPQTTINGKVTDAFTGVGYSNIPVRIIRKAPGIDGSRYIDFDSVYTNQFGDYQLKFTPLIPGEYNVELFPDNDLIKRGVINVIDPIRPPVLTLGEINKNDFKVNKLVNLTVNLKNSSNYDYTGFSLTARPYYCIEYFASDVAITKDTTLHFKVPRFIPLTILSYFFEGGKSDLRKPYNLNALSADSTIIINN